MKKWALFAVLLIAALASMAVAIGWQLPVAHRASRQATFRVPPEAVWTAITNVDAFPAWRKGVERVERLPARDSGMVWAEHTSDGRITLATERSDPPRLLVVRVADRDLPFGGAWTYEIAPVPDGSRLTITEDGEIYNPIFRVVARFLVGYESTINDYLESLERHLHK